jgi:hypothetical protein
MESGEKVRQEDYRANKISPENFEESGKRD